LGRQILERLIKDVEQNAIVEFRPRQEGNTLHAILAPKKDAGGHPAKKDAVPKQQAASAATPAQSRANQA
jgi:hypothetical protein